MIDSLYSIMSNYDKAWQFNAHNKNIAANCQILNEIVGNTKISEEIVADFLLKKNIKSDGFIAKQALITNAFQARFQKTLAQVQTSHVCDRQIASELIKKVFLWHSDKPHNAWIKLEEINKLKHLTTVSPSIKSARIEMDEGPLKGSFTGYLHLGLKHSHGANQQEAGRLAAQLGGEAIRAPSGYYYIRLHISKALKPSHHIAQGQHAAVLAHTPKPACAAAPAPQVLPKVDVKAVLEKVAGIVESQYKFSGYGVHFLPFSKSPVGMIDTMIGTIANIGNVGVCHAWKMPPSINAPLPVYIHGAAVRLPKGLSVEQYADMRKLTQQGVMTNKGLNADQAKAFAKALGGVVVEATLPYKASDLLQDAGPDVNVHCIFQTGLNFAGYAGGGIPADPQLATHTMQDYIQKNAYAALDSAVKNGSNLLVYNIGIGAGFFAGAKKQEVLQANIHSLCAAFQQAKLTGKQIECAVPAMPQFTADQRELLCKAGIRIIEGDKGAAAALAARQGLKVSETIAADPLSILGVHGPGLWWESAGSASDEERAAFLTPCYALGYVPIDVYVEGQQPRKIAAISEFMM